MKICIFLLLFNLIGIFTYAQLLVGSEGGISENVLNTNISNLSSSKLKSKTGYTFNLILRLKLNDFLNLETLGSVIQKNYSYYRTDSLTGIYQNSKNNYMQIPLILNIMNGRRLKYFFGSGIFISYWMSGIVQGNIPDILSTTTEINSLGNSVDNIKIQQYQNKYKFDSTRDNRIELGWVLSGGINYNLIKNYFITTNIRYYNSSTDLQKQYMVNQTAKTNKTLAFSVGFIYVPNLKYH